MSDPIDTNTDNGPPLSDPEASDAHVFAGLVANVIADALDPLKDAIEALRGDLGLTNGATRSVLHRVTDLEERVGDLEARRQ